MNKRAGYVAGFGAFLLIDVYLYSLLNIGIYNLPYFLVLLFCGIMALVCFIGATSDDKVVSS